MNRDQRTGHSAGTWKIVLNCGLMLLGFAAVRAHAIEHEAAVHIDTFYLHESNYENNAASVLFQLTRPAGRPSQVRVLAECPNSEHCGT